MYKKISHTITEEHFDHPHAAEIKRNLDHKSKSSFVYIDGSSQIEKASVAAWSKFADRVASLVNSAVAGTADVELLKQKLTTDIEAIGDLLKDSYSSTAVTDFNRGLSTVAGDLLEVITLTVTGQPTDEAVAKMHSDTKMFAKQLQSLNYYWDADTVYSLISTAQEHYIEQAKARMAGQWAESIAAADAAFKVLVEKTSTGDSGVADVFACGIVMTL